MVCSRRIRDHRQEEQAAVDEEGAMEEEMTRTLLEESACGPCVGPFRRVAV